MTLNNCTMLNSDNVLDDDNIFCVVCLKVCETLLSNGMADLLGIELLEL